MGALPKDCLIKKGAEVLEVPKDGPRDGHRFVDSSSFLNVLLKYSLTYIVLNII